MAGAPYPKSAQLARQEKRYRRKVASPKMWARIAAEKQGPCRACAASSARKWMLAAGAATRRASIASARRLILAATAART